MVNLLSGAPRLAIKQAQPEYFVRVELWLISTAVKRGQGERGEINTTTDPSHGKSTRMPLTCIQAIDAEI